MSPAARELVGRLQRILCEMAELEKTDPAAVDELVGTLIHHLRAWRPVSVAPLGTLPPPDELPRDPRGA